MQKKEGRLRALVGYRKKGCRKAVMGYNRCADFDGGKSWAVFRHTFYLGRWYYDGYSAHATRSEAEQARNEWLKGG